MQPLVSICIPTYNRSECLKRTIDSIILQPEFLSGEVEIIVSDNASTDDTEKVCDDYCDYSNFYYYKNIENVVDKNFPIVISKAHGKLRKLNNDTFVLSNDALSKLCGVVKNYGNTRPFIFFSNKDGITKELNFHNFVTSVSYWITWSPCFSIWEDECENIESDTCGCQLRLWQVKKAYELSYKKNNALLFNEILGENINPPKKDISYGLYKIFYCNYMELLMPYVINGTLNEADIEYLEKKLLFEFFPDWILRFELNNTDMKYSKEEDLKSAIFNQYKDKPYWHEFERLYNKKLMKEKMKFFIKRRLGRA